MLEKTHFVLLKYAKIAMVWLGSTSSLVAHTAVFAGMFSLLLFGIALDSILLILTTLVSMEAIYLAIFLQMTVNQMTELTETTLTPILKKEKKKRKARKARI